MMATGAPGLWIDDRYRGSHGIGRYAKEVTSRLTVPWTPLGFSGAPANPLDAFRRVPRGVREGLIYSPGYGAFIGARRQILTIHDLIHLQVDWPGRAMYLAYYNAVVRPVITRNKLVLTVSETSREAIREWVRDDRVEIVNAGIGCSPAFVPDGEVVRSDRPYVLFVGNTRTHKNLAVVMDAVARTREVELRIVAPAAEAAQIQRWVNDRDLHGRVTLHVGIDDAQLAELYRGASLTLMPSLLEGFGLPALESVRCGTPVAYWAGCRSVGEIVADRGPSIAVADDVQEWSAVIREWTSSDRRVTPPSDSRYSWASTAIAVSAVLGSHAAGSGASPDQTTTEAAT